MNPRLLAFAILASGLAGCVAQKDGQPGPMLPVAPSYLYAPDCSVKNSAEPCLALASHNPSPSKAEIDLAVNPKDPLNVVVGSKDLDRTASDCVWAIPQVTHDGGRTWKTVYLGGQKADRSPTDPLYPWECITDPILAFDKNGIVIYALQAYNVDAPTPAPPPLPVVGGTNQGSAFYFARSKDGGDTWDKIIPIHVGDGTAIFHDYPRMTSNPATGSTYAVWNQISVVAEVPVLVATRDGGETAAPPVYVPVPDAPGGAGQTGLAAAHDGTVYLMMGAGNSYYLTQSKDDAMTFETPWHAFDTHDITCPLKNSQFRCFTSVEIAVDNSGGPRDGGIYATWPDAEKDEGDILASVSQDGGHTWSPPVRVNHDNTTRAQIMPRITVSHDGVAHIVYLTRAYDEANKLLDAEYAYSEDGGQTWVPERLTTLSFDGDKGVHQDGFPFIGDYIGIDTSGSRVYAGFPDTASGVAEVLVASLVHA